MTLEVKTALLPNGETLSYRENRYGTLHAVDSREYGFFGLWEPLLTHADMTQRFIAVDLRGYGESSYQNPIGDMKDFSSDLHQFVEQIGLRHVMVMGWSNGGGIAMRLRQIIQIAYEN